MGPIVLFGMGVKALSLFITEKDGIVEPASTLGSLIESMRRPDCRVDAVVIHGALCSVCGLPDGCECRDGTEDEVDKAWMTKPNEIIETIGQIMCLANHTESEESFLKAVAAH